MKIRVEVKDEAGNVQQYDVSGWRWFDAVIKFKDENVCNYASTTNGSIEDAKKQAANVVIGQTAEILSIAFR